LKRKEAEWGKSLGPEDLNELTKRLERIQEKGVQYEPLKLDENTFILHFKVPSDWPAEQLDQVAKWLERFKKKLPKNGFCLVTVEDLKLQIHRPGDPSQALREANNILERRITKIEEQLMEHYEHIDRLLHYAGPPALHQRTKEEIDDEHFCKLQPKLEIKK
jgi:hypothetical protein